MKKNKTNDNIGENVQKHRRLKYGGLATTFTILFILAAIALNFFLGILADRYVLEIDMTSNSLYEISADTEEVLMDLTEQITITVLADETTYESTELLSRIREYLKRYAALSNGLITVEYVNADLNPQIYDRFNVLGDLSSNDIVIESSKRFKKYSPTDLYELDTDSEGTEYLVGLRAEQRLTSGILFVTADKIPQAAYIQGHGEDTWLDELSGLLTSGNYEVTKVNLLNEDISEDIDMLIISSPTSDYTTEEIDKIDAFMDDGGSMIVAMTPQATNTLTNLEIYFEEWGARYEKSVVMDNSRSLSGYPTYILPSVSTFEGITDNLPSSRYMLVPGARPITQLFTENNWRTTTALMSSSSDSYAKSLTDGAVISYEKNDEDIDGPFALGVLSQEQHTSSSLETTYSRILFLNAGMVSDSVLEVDSFLNSKYMVAAINYMNADNDSVIISSKQLSASVLSLSSSQMMAIFWILVIIIPVGALVLGLIVWLRRRHL